MMQAPRLAYLKALDIDVWVRRDHAPPDERRPEAEPHTETPAPTTRRVPPNHDAAHGAAAVPPPARPVRPTPRTSVTADGDAPTPAPPDPPVQFVIRCFKQGNTLALVDEPLWRHRRLLFDVAKSLDSSGASERQDIVFEWPQLKSGDAGAAAAGAAFRAFLGAQTTTRTRWLAVGARVAQLIGDAPRDAHVLLPDALEDIDKRALWREILAKR